MKAFIKRNKLATVLLLLIVVLFSCGGGSDDDTVIIPPVDPVEIIPTNLSLNISIIGADTDNPNGDGSGSITVDVSATDAVKYLVKFGDGIEEESNSGQVQHTYSIIGVNNYIVSVIAYSTTDNTITSFKQIGVFVSNQFNKLVWADEFDVEGAPNSNNWTYDLDSGTNGGSGWGNGEKQYYTDRPENVIVEDGLLKITAKREDYSGAEFTSARLKTQGKYDFTYGRVEVRAKLPEGSGTWPAIWMLGSNITTVSWPACGEIDIMEHWGYNPGVVSSATHKPSCYGGCENVGAGSTTLTNYATEFHVYGIEWYEDAIDFLIDGEYKYRYKPSVKDDDTWPYTKGQFIILNIAMGGSWFEVDPDFIQSSMEIDYVRVYQKEE